ncbi:hypothetical protein SAMN05444157_0999 [Frankineae bacterium MT45]|nr:hypothetical protein SAMN05444157_0999 [Frankineae bacterium MT45]
MFDLARIAANTPPAPIRMYPTSASQNPAWTATLTPSGPEGESCTSSVANPTRATAETTSTPAKIPPVAAATQRARDPEEAATTLAPTQAANSIQVTNECCRPMFGDTTIITPALSLLPSADRSGITFGPTNVYHRSPASETSASTAPTKILTEPARRRRGASGLGIASGFGTPESMQHRRSDGALGRTADRAAGVPCSPAQQPRAPTAAPPHDAVPLSSRSCACVSGR